MDERFQSLIFFLLVCMFMALQVLWITILQKQIAFHDLIAASIATKM
jgi:hypothetical protein